MVTLACLFISPTASLIYLAAPKAPLRSKELHVVLFLQAPTYTVHGVVAVQGSRDRTALTLWSTERACMWSKWLHTGKPVG